MEHNFKVLNSGFFRLPIKRNKQYFPKFLESLLDNYITQLEHFDGSIKPLLNRVMPEIEGLIKSITNAVKIYYKGYPAQAYLELESGLNLIADHLDIATNNIYIEPSIERGLYRLRNYESKLEASGMFHVPFEHRSLLRTQRYSIPGLPCLYLGSSVYLCWKEIREPDKKFVQAARLERNINKSKLLYLSTTPHRVTVLGKNFPTEKWFHQQFVKYLISWPILASTHIMVLQDNDHFKPEYIIPQLTLQWVTSSKDIDGIEYISTRVSENLYADYGLHTNQVYPVKTILEGGFCPELTSKFKITEPIMFPELSDFRPNQNDISKWVQFAHPTHLLLCIENGNYKVPYRNTDFGKMEIELCKQEATYLYNS